MQRQLVSPSLFQRFAGLLLRRMISTLRYGESVPFPLFFRRFDMFEQLYTFLAAVARHCSGPLLNKRLAFLAHLRD